MFLDKMIQINIKGRELDFSFFQCLSISNIPQIKVMRRTCITTNHSKNFARWTQTIDIKNLQSCWIASEIVGKVYTEIRNISFDFVIDITGNHFFFTIFKISYSYLFIWFQICKLNFECRLNAKEYFLMISAFPFWFYTYAFDNELWSIRVGHHVWASEDMEYVIIVQPWIPRTTCVL